MPFHVLLCDTADEAARLQYQLLRVASDLVVDVATDPFAAMDSASRLSTARHRVRSHHGDAGWRRAGPALPSLVAFLPDRPLDLAARSRRHRRGPGGGRGRLPPEGRRASARSSARSAPLPTASWSSPPTVATLLGDELLRSMADARAARDELDHLANDGVGGQLGEGGLPRQHLARAPDARHRREGHRLRPSQPVGGGGRTRGVPHAAAGLARQADGDRRRDHHHGRARARHLRVGAGRRRPRTARASRGR